ncbi:hypothetical protein [Croceiramulus getboli]|nr:hypothetical protein P8624_08130 [Flavobacteriaceae bacterium YJPT1-3]
MQPLEFSSSAKYQAIYSKALDIKRLSRLISDYLQYELTPLRADGREDESLYFTGDIIRQGDSLAPEILKAEAYPFQEERLRQVQSVERLTRSLQRTCDRLARVESNGRDFIDLLRQEIRGFKSLQRNWKLMI